MKSSIIKFFAALAAAGLCIYFAPNVGAALLDIFTLLHILVFGAIITFVTIKRSKTEKTIYQILSQSALYAIIPTIIAKIAVAVALNISHGIEAAAFWSAIAHMSAQSILYGLIMSLILTKNN